MSVAELIARLQRVEDKSLPVVIAVGGSAPDVLEWPEDEHGSAGVTLS